MRTGRKRTVLQRSWAICSVDRLRQRPHYGKPHYCMTSCTETHRLLRHIARRWFFVRSNPALPFVVLIFSVSPFFLTLHAMAQQSTTNGDTPINSDQLTPSSEAVPDAPSVSRREPNSNSTIAEIVPLTLPIRMEQPKPTRVVDRRFVRLHLLEVGAVILDIESTHYGLSHGGTEANPLFGSRPSRTIQYGIGLPVTFGMTCWSYYLKRNAPHSRRWQILPLLAIGIHGGATVNNLATAHNH